MKRNTVEYDLAGAATPRDAAELRAFAESLRKDVLAWIAATHPELLRGK